MIVVGTLFAAILTMSSCFRVTQGIENKPPAKIDVRIYIYMYSIRIHLIFTLIYLNRILFIFVSSLNATFC